MRTTLDNPFYNPYLRGSYSYYRVGQYTLFGGAEGQASGQCHFAGEHCSGDFQGYMEGGAREGARAAEEIGIRAVLSNASPSSGKSARISSSCLR